jgi:hypothetical protein
MSVLVKKSFINIGTDAIGRDVDIDLETLLVTRALVQGASGAGKSRFLRRLAEQAFGKVPIIILDPEGEFASLRERFDFVLAGRGGETPADPRSAAMLATKLLELRASAVCDLYSMKPLDRHTFVRLFIEALLNADKRLWHPYLIMVDEAHRMCPEKGAGESEASEAMTALSTDGRKHGLCAIYATQRLGKLRKDAAAELLNVFIGQTFIDIDRMRAADALGVPKGKEQRELFARLKVLSRGSFYGLGQAVSLDATLIKIGDVQTTHPKVGAKASSTVPPAPAAIKALLPQLADLPKQAEDKARTEGELRKEIVDLRKQLKAAPVAKPIQQTAPSKEELSAEHSRGWAGGIAHAEREAYNSRRTAWRALKRVQEANDRTAKAVMEELAYYPESGPEKPKAGECVPARAVVVPKAEALQRPTLPPRERPPIAETDAVLSKPEQRIIDALAWLESIGVAEPENPAVSFMARYTLNGSYFNARGSLRGKGLLVYLDGSRLQLTDEGRARAHALDIPGDAEALQNQVLSKLPTPEQRVLKPLIKAYPESVDNAALAQSANYTLNGSFFNARGRLKSLGLVEYVKNGVRARALLFPE